MGEMGSDPGAGSTTGAASGSGLGVFARLDVERAGFF
jgi:hypothetical protein